jgi:hypothetical protein
VGSFTAILADIKAASDAFEAGARDFRNAIPDNLAGTAVDSGNASLDQTIRAVLAGIDALHTQVAGALAKTSGQLMNAHDDYQRTDGDSARELYDAMLKDDPVG